MSSTKLPTSSSTIDCQTGPNQLCFLSALDIYQVQMTCNCICIHKHWVKTPWRVCLLRRK